MTKPSDPDEIEYALEFSRFNCSYGFLGLAKDWLLFSLRF
jgi:hypothetical protein